MFKFLIILGLLGFAVVKFLGFFLRVFRWLDSAISPPSDSPPQKSKPNKVKKDGVNVEYVSEEELRRRQKSSDFKGGEYVDFEEED
ncbi:MAG: DUF4834 family protein [Bacteroidia bacterium]|nr:DUF4834 family protein [Bacteroidia bacterium]